MRHGERVHAGLAFAGLAMSQPNTFSPGGAITYVTTFGPDPEGCNVWALRTIDGSTAWCATLERSAGGSAVEVDENGDLYVTADRFLHSLTADGEDRWSAELGAPPMSKGELGDGPLGVHFTPAGHAATITASGVVFHRFSPTAR